MYTGYIGLVANQMGDEMVLGLCLFFLRFYCNTRALLSVSPSICYISILWWLAQLRQQQPRPSRCKCRMCLRDFGVYAPPNERETPECPFLKRDRSLYGTLLGFHVSLVWGANDLMTPDHTLSC